MAIVFSDEIEAILRAGPPRIDWEAISAELKAEFLAGPGNRLSTEFDGDGAEGPGEELRNVYENPPSLVVQDQTTGAVRVRCCMWSCLHARDRMARLYVDRPVVYASSGVVASLKSLAAVWVTFSPSSVRELNEMGIDSVFTTSRARAKKIDGAVVYRGTSDTESSVAIGCAVMLPSLVGTVSYVTAHKEDNTQLAEGIMHMFSQGGRVCGYASRDSGCGICNDTGVVIGTLYGAPVDVSTALPYCVCPAGDWREAKDDEDREYNNGAFIMGRYDGGPSDDDRGTRWSDDEVEFERGMCHEPPGTPRPIVDVSSYDVEEREEDEGEVEPLVLSAVVGGGGTELCVAAHAGGTGASGSAADDRIAGYCYLDMVKQGMVVEAMANLQEWPSVEELLLSPASVFDLDRMAILAFEVRDNADGSIPGMPVGSLLHVCPAWLAVGQRVFLLEALRHVCTASKLVYDDTTLAWALCAGGTGFSEVSGIALDSVAGGDPEPGDGGSAGTGSVVDPSKWARSESVTVPDARTAALGATFVKTYRAVLKEDGTYGAEVSPYVPKAGGTSCKVLCDICGCMVNPSGHSGRCVVPPARTSSKFTVKAWLGDAVHSLDVRAVLAARGLEPAERHKAYTELVEAPGQAEYYLLLDDKPEEVVMQNGVLPKPHTIASMFERHYVGRFRDRYLLDLFGMDGQTVDGLVQSLMIGATSLVDTGLVPARRYAVVMPPGHGKSVLHGVGRLLDADSLCDVAACRDLAGLRARAGTEPVRSHAYVAEWARLLGTACGPSSVLMSSTAEVARAAGFTVVAVLLIDRGQWLADCQGVPSDKMLMYEACYAAAGSSVVAARTFPSRYALRVELNGILGMLSV